MKVRKIPDLKNFTMNIRQAQTMWLDWLSLQSRSAKTIATYDAALLNLRKLCDQRGLTKIYDIRPADLRSWHAELCARDNTPSTVEQFLRTARHWLQWLCDHGFLFRNPATGLPRMTIPKRVPRCPTESQMLNLLSRLPCDDVVEIRDKALLETAYASGARLAELAGLRVGSIDLERRLVRLVGKGEKDRVVPLTRAAIDALRRYLRDARPQLVRCHPDCGALFLGVRAGEPLNSPGVADAVARAGRIVGLRLTPHDFRRAFASHLIAHRAHPAHVRDMLGHQGFRHLAAYIRFTPPTTS